MHRSQDGNAKWRAETEQSGTIRNKVEQGGLCWNRPLENPSEHEELLLTLQCERTTLGVAHEGGGTNGRWQKGYG